jgi:hypothetical protein
MNLVLKILAAIVLTPLALAAIAFLAYLVMTNPY